MLDAVSEQILPPQEADLLHSQHQALLEISQVIAVHRDLNELFHDLARRLPRIVPFDFINLVLHDPTREVMRLHGLVAPESSTIKPGLELPVDQSPAGLVWKSQQPLMVEVDDVAVESRFPQVDPTVARERRAILLSGTAHHGTASSGRDGIRESANEKLSQSRLRLHAASGQTSGCRGRQCASF